MASQQDSGEPAGGAGMLADRLGLAGRTALVTGGTRNIGRETALALARAGASVAIVGASDEEALRAAVKSVTETGADAFGTIADLRRESEAVRAVGEARDALGEIDILVNNASIRPHSDFADVTIDEWDDVMAVNLRAPFLLSRETLPGMVDRGWGRVVNLGGISATHGRKSRPHVIASKAGITGLTRAIAAEAAGAGNVTANCVVPGHIDVHRDDSEEYQRRLQRIGVGKIPLGRLGEPGEIADVVLFLCSEMSAYMTGQTVYVSGGSFPMSGSR